MTFGTSLRGFRERRTPQSTGIPASLPRVRRTPGLRRDELAERACISEEHLKRLEQGRRRPSPGVVDALATALRLSASEHAQLRMLAGFAVPRLSPEAEQPDGDPMSHSPDGLVPREITPAARRILDRLTEVAVCVCDASWTVLGGNQRWNATGCPAGVAQGRGRNMAWRVFTDAPTDVFRTAECLASFRAALVTDLRNAARRYPADPQLHALIADLRAHGAGFSRLWDAAPATEHGYDRLNVPDPEHGRADLDKEVLTLAAGDLRVVVFTTP
ncbi:MAG TPA: helix-turn-helix domain-containing protein [Pseudonocardiaceae bacterium]